MHDKPTVLHVYYIPAKRVVTRATSFSKTTLGPVCISDVGAAGTTSATATAIANATSVTTATLCTPPTFSSVTTFTSCQTKTFDSYQVPSSTLGKSSLMLEAAYSLD